MTHRVCTDSVLSIQASKRGDLSEQESTCTPIFHWCGRRSTAASRCLIHPQAPSWINNRALSCKCSGKTRAEIQLFFSLFPQRPYTCAVQWIYMCSVNFWVCLNLLFFGWVGVGVSPVPLLIFRAVSSPFLPENLVQSSPVQIYNHLFEASSLHFLYSSSVLLNIFLSLLKNRGWSQVQKSDYSSKR